MKYMMKYRTYSCTRSSTLTNVQHSIDWYVNGITNAWCAHTVQYRYIMQACGFPLIRQRCQPESISWAEKSGGCEAIWAAMMGSIVRGVMSAKTDAWYQTLRAPRLMAIRITCLARGSHGNSWIRDSRRTSIVVHLLMTVIILGSFWGSKLYSDQKLTFNEKRTNIKTIVYTLERESYLPTVSIYQPLMCPHTRF